MNSVSRFEKFSKTIYNGQDVLKNHIFQCYPILHTDDVEDYEQVKDYAEVADYVWLVDKSIKVLDTFPWHFRPSAEQSNGIHLFPYVRKKSRHPKSWNKVQLVPTKFDAKKKYTHNNICGVYDPYYGKEKFDIFFLGSRKNSEYKKLKEKYNIQIVDSYSQAQELTSTDMFWLIPNDVNVSENFDFSFEPDEWSYKYNHVFGNGKRNQFDGIFLCNKFYNPSDREIDYRFLVNKKEVRMIASTPKPYDFFEIDNYDEYKTALESSTTEMFWMSSKNIKVNIDLDFYIPHHEKDLKNKTHAFLHSNNKYNGLFLCSKNKILSEKEVTYRFPVERIEHDIIATGPVAYDKFYVDSYEEYECALNNSKTEMFWMDSRNISSDIPEIYFDFENEYDRHTNHAFVHNADGRQLYNGLFLCSTKKPLNKKEVEHRHIIERKEWKVVGSTQVEYEKFYIDTYGEYLNALEQSKTEMFWALSRNVKIKKNFKFDKYFTHDNTFDRTINHAFLHDVDGEKLYSGVFLCSKHSKLSKKEIEFRHPVKRKEWNEIASTKTRYDVFDIRSYDDYLDAMQKSKTEMFWGKLQNLTIIDESIFDLYFKHDNTFDRKMNHAFLHKVNDKLTYDGLYLFSKHKPVTKKEIDYKHIVERKEYEQVVTGPVLYNIFEVDNYDEYLEALSKSTTEMFWIKSRNVEINPNFKFDLFFDDRDDEFEYERNENHVFVHKVGDKEYYNGVFLMSKNKPVSKKEIEHRHLVTRKEWNTVASGPVEYDRFIVDTYEDYLKALDESKTEMFWAISSNVDTSNFDFDVYFTHDNEYDRSTSHSFIHEVEGKQYHNGIFLLPKNVSRDKVN